MRISALTLLVLFLFFPYVSALTIQGVQVSDVYPGDNGVILVVTNEILSPGMCPGDAFNCTLVPDMVSTDIFYVSKDGYYFLGEYPEDPNVTFEEGLWKLFLHTWNGSVKNVTFDPACLKPSSRTPLNLSDIPVHWKKIVLGSLIIEYPRDFLGFYHNSSGDYTVVIENMRVKKILPYFPFLISVNGKLYPLYTFTEEGLTQVPSKVSPNLTCTSSTSTTGRNTTTRSICGPGLIGLLALVPLIRKR
ncbi:hypothetical protein [Thermococcus sp.]